MSDFVVNSINDEKGYGVFANKKIVKGDIILEEEPFVSCQFEWNKAYNYLACDYCLKSLETAQDMAKRLVQNPNYKLPFPEMAPAPINIVYCEKCKAAYCSLKCKESAYNSFHQVMCPGNKNIDNEAYLDLVDYWRGIHLPPETACISIIVRILAQYKQAKNKDQFSSILNGFCRKATNELRQISHKLLGSQFADHLLVLREKVATLIGDPGMAGWLNVDGFTQLLALLGTNQQGIGSSSIAKWYEALSEEQDEDPGIAHFYEMVDGTAGPFLDCEGVGLYALQSKVNHSCLPNAEVRFDNGDHKLSLVATSDIEAGDEICISYIDLCSCKERRSTRQKTLQENYLFMCECGKCEEQKVMGIDESDSEDDEDSYDNTPYSSDDDAEEAVPPVLAPSSCCKSNGDRNCCDELQQGGSSACSK